MAKKDEAEERRNQFVRELAKGTRKALEKAKNEPSKDSKAAPRGSGKKEEEPFHFRLKRAIMAKHPGRRMEPWKVAAAEQQKTIKEQEERIAKLEAEVAAQRKPKKKRK